MVGSWPLTTPPFGRRAQSPRKGRLRQGERHGARRGPRVRTCRWPRRGPAGPGGGSRPGFEAHSPASSSERGCHSWSRVSTPCQIRVDQRRATGVGVEGQLAPLHGEPGASLAPAPLECARRGDGQALPSRVVQHRGPALLADQRPALELPAGHRPIVGRLDLDPLLDGGLRAAPSRSGGSAPRRPRRHAPRVRGHPARARAPGPRRSRSRRRRRRAHGAGGSRRGGGGRLTPSSGRARSRERHRAERRRSRSPARS